MKYIESENCELKEKVNDKLIREIVSFLNANGGSIYIGIRDDGFIVGIENIDETMKRIMEIITSQIEPVPQELIRNEVIYDDNKYIINVKIDKGIEPIYCIKKYGFSSVRSEWNELHAWKGANVSLHIGKQAVFGQVVGIGDKGEICLLVDGEERKYLGGELSLRLRNDS